ncbi:hypothetical protein D3C72_1802170 [compost metagenome]
MVNQVGWLTAQAQVGREFHAIRSPSLLSSPFMACSHELSCSCSDAAVLLPALAGVALAVLCPTVAGALGRRCSRFSGTELCSRRVNCTCHASRPSCSLAVMRPANLAWRTFTDLASSEPTR